MNNNISIIVTCYNLEEYISAALASVLDQSYQGSFEVLVVDDCSTDRSSEIVKSFSSVRYLRTPANRGVLMATVLGLQNTTGEFVFFLDGDDVWHTDKLRNTMNRFLQDDAICLLTHDVEFIDRYGRQLNRTSRPHAVMGGGKDIGDDQLVKNGILRLTDYVWLGSAYSVRRSLSDIEGFIDWAGALPDPLNTYQDWPLAFWVASRPNVKAAYVDRKLMQYRLHGANHSGDASTATKARRNVLRSLNTVEAMGAIFHMRNGDPYIKRAVNDKANYYRYLLNLYSENRAKAFLGFLHSLSYILLRERDPVKEALRLLGVLLLGAERFIRIARRANDAKGMAALSE